MRTVNRWEREQGLPVHRHKTGAIFAYKPELDAWWINRREQIESDPAETAARPAFWSRRWKIPVAVASVILALSFAGFIMRRKLKPEPKLVPLTTYPGFEGAPSLSPDGNEVAFQRNGDIFVKQVDGEAFRQLTNTPAYEGSPAWSPDGRQIAFIRDRKEILLISPLGGVERKVAEIRAKQPILPLRMAWTPDSKSLIVSDLTSEEQCVDLYGGTGYLMPSKAANIRISSGNRMEPMCPVFGTWAAPTTARFSAPKS